MFEENKKELLEGNELADTSTAEPEQDMESGLNNSTVPTPEEEENAGITPSMPEATQPLPEDATDAVPGVDINDELGIHEASAAQTFTQSQVDEIAGKIRKETREKTLKAVYSRYGVNSEEEMDDIYSDAQRLATLQDMYDTDKKAWKEMDDQKGAELTEVKERVALLESGIDKDRYEDAKLILRGKGLEVTVDNIANELATHPEWKKVEEPAPVAEHFAKVEAPAESIPAQPKEKTTINVLGNAGEEGAQEPELSDREKAMKLFRV